ncbi:MAG: mechanosensitive ion channel [Bacteroidales bacterium]|nr:mechanosensitive ion channel [Bacteroidales bacterium]
MNDLIINLKYLQIDYWDLILGLIIILFASFISIYIKNHLKGEVKEISKKIMLIATWGFSIIMISLMVVPSLREIAVIDNKYVRLNPVELAIIVIILFVNLFLNKILKRWFNSSNVSKKKSPLIMFRSLLWLISIHYILKILLIQYNEILKLELISIKDVAITLADILFVFISISLTALSILFLKLALNRQVKREKIDASTSVTLLNISKYFIWTIVIVFIFQSIGFNLSILLAGSAALLVGIGMGIQQLFNDFASGLILLIERQVKVGDYIDADTISGTILEIGFRTTNVLTRDNIRVIIPNSLLVSGSVINWTKGENYSRFALNVGVAYGSDTQKVKQILLKCANDHQLVLKKPEPQVQFTDFGTSSLDFKLLFYSDNPFRIEFVKSDLRFNIDAEFRKQGIEIPFTQMDVHFRNDLNLQSKKE